MALLPVRPSDIGNGEGLFGDVGGDEGGDDSNLGDGAECNIDSISCTNSCLAVVGIAEVDCDVICSCCLFRSRALDVIAFRRNMADDTDLIMPIIGYAKCQA